MVVTGTYDPDLVALSILVTCLASYSAIDLSARLGTARRFMCARVARGCRSHEGKRNLVKGVCAKNYCSVLCAMSSLGLRCTSAIPNRPSAILPGRSSTNSRMYWGWMSATNSCWPNPEVGPLFYEEPRSEGKSSAWDDFAKDDMLGKIHNISHKRWRSSRSRIPAVAPLPLDSAFGLAFVRCAKPVLIGNSAKSCLSHHV
jgi:hypothetical protein